jgi:hypothetical protein
MSSKNQFIAKLMKRWNLKNATQVILVLVVFALTGFSIMYIDKLLMNWMGIDKESPAWMRITVFIVLILPIYQVVLLAWGFLFGQFKFFWEYEVKVAKRMALWFRKLIALFRNSK